MASNKVAWGWQNQSYVRFEVWHSSRDIPNNRSTFGYKIVFEGARGYGDSGSINYTIKDQWSSNRASGSKGNFYYYSNTDYSIGSGYFTIYHNPDGTMPNINFSLAISSDLIGSRTVPVTLTGVPTIPRASSVSSITNFTVPGGNCTFAIAAAHTGFTHKAELKVGGKHVAGMTGIKGGSHTFALNAAQHNQIIAAMPNSNSVTIQVVITTWNGNTQIGSSSSRNGVAYLAGTIVPTITNIAWSDTNATAKGMGVVVQHNSRLSISLSGQAGQSATVRSYKIEFDGQALNGQSGTTQVIKGSGNLYIKATITDSRGRTNTKQQLVQVQAYAPPKIWDTRAIRSNSAGTADPLGGYMNTTFKGSVTPLSDKNQLTYQVQIAERGSSSWVTKVNKNGAASITIKEIVAGIDVKKSYDVRMIIKDKFNTTLALTSLSSGTVSLDIGVEVLGVGKIHEKGTLDVKGDVFQRGRRVIDHCALPEGMNGMDFNNYIQRGRYRITANNALPSMPNSPAGAGAGYLTVSTLNDYAHASVPWMVVTQIYEDIGFRKFQRNYNTDGNGKGTWTSWLRYDSNMDATWTTCSNISVSSPYCRVRRVGMVVYFEARFNHAFKFNDWKNVAIVPAGFRPSQLAGFAGAGEGGVSGVCNVGTDGTVSVNHRFEPATRSWFVFTASWIAA